MNNKSANKVAAVPTGAGSEFPKHSLKIALRVAQALEDKNSGNPMPPTDVAIAIEKSPGSSDFRMLLSSSIKYGLTTGSFNQSKITLTELARDIVAPISDGSKNKALLKAAFAPPLFQSIFAAYKGKKVPDMQFFQNALVRDFGVSKDQAARCAAVFYENAEYLGLVRQATTGKWLASEPSVIEREELREADEVNTDENGNASQSGEESQRQSLGETRTAPTAKNAIFIGHGKNRTPLEQLEKFLTEYKIPNRVVVDEANKGRPI